MKMPTLVAVVVTPAALIVSAVAGPAGAETHLPAGQVASVHGDPSIGDEPAIATMDPNGNHLETVLPVGPGAPSSQDVRVEPSRPQTQIVWARSYSSGGGQIVSSRPDGSHLRGLTPLRQGVNDTNPKLSPDGRSVVFERDFADGSTQIVIASSDGATERPLDLGCVDPCAVDLAPSWTPDGGHLVFQRVIGPFDITNNDSAASAVMWITDLSGQRIRRLSQPGIDGVYEDSWASFAPDGYLVFVRLRDRDLSTAVFRMNRDGTGVRQLTAWGVGGDLPEVSPATSGPTHNLVVMEADTPGRAAAIATVSADATPPGHWFNAIRFLTSRDSKPVTNFNPTWAPDGWSIAYVRFDGQGDIWRMRWNGLGKRPVSTLPEHEDRPYWGRGATP